MSRPPLHPSTLAFAVAAGVAACGPPSASTWLDHLDPLRPGGEVVPGYVLGAPRRGYEHDVVLPVTGPSGVTVEVHIVDRGRWPDALPAGAYGVDWEQPRTSAPPADADAVAAAVAAALRDLDAGPVDGVAVGNEPPSAVTPLVRVLRRLGPPGVVPGLGLLGVLLGCAAAWRRPGARDALGVCALAAALRWLLGPWAPLHTNGQGNAWVAGALDPELLDHYGPGYAELWGLLVRLGRPDTVIFGANALLSAVVPAMATIIARGAGLSRRHALAAGGLLALDPVALRAGATEVYLVPAALLAALVAGAAQRDDRLGHLAVALCAACAARLHPVAWLPVATAPLLALPVSPAAVRRALAAGALGATLGGGRVIARVLDAVGDGRLAPAPAELSATTGAVATAVTALVLWRRPALAPAVGLTLALDLGLRGAYGQHPLWQAAFDRVWMTPLAVAAAAVAPARVPAWGLAVATLLLVAPSAPMLAVRTIDQSEHAWARAALDATPPGCVVAYVTRTDPVTTVFLPVPPPGVTLAPLDARGRLDPSSLPAASCRRYLRTSACSSARGADACARLEATLALGPGELTTLPAVPSHRDVSYPAPTLQVGVFPLDPG